MRGRERERKREGGRPRKGDREMREKVSRACSFSPVMETCSTLHYTPIGVTSLICFTADSGGLERGVARFTNPLSELKLRPQVWLPNPLGIKECEKLTDLIEDIDHTPARPVRLTEINCLQESTRTVLCSLYGTCTMYKEQRTILYVSNNYWECIDLPETRTVLLELPITVWNLRTLMHCLEAELTNFLTYSGNFRTFKRCLELKLSSFQALSGTETFEL